jgi:hypothetical protein
MRSMGDAKSGFGWPAAAAIVGLAAIGAALYAWRSLTQTPGRLASEARQIAAAFRSGSVTTSFTSYATEVQGSSLLQFATLKQVEVFERKDEAALFWGQLALPEVVVEARAPVEYTYYLDLQERWLFVLEGQVLLVTAPPVRFNTPALDVSALRYEIKKGSVLRDEAAALASLRQGLTELSKQRARAHVLLVRETGRRQTEEFVETWLQARFSDGKQLRARVRFADEPPAPAPRRPIG